MRSLKLMFVLLVIVVIGSGCASADKRLGQGWEQEQMGQYENAVMRYVQALEKEPNMEDARIRLRHAGALAVAERYEQAEDLAARGNLVGSGNAFRRADNVIAQARSVGERLDLPQNYAQRRREVFDGAFETLMVEAVMARDQGRWEDGRVALHQARNDFEPTGAQRNRSFEEESVLLVQWSENEYAQGHLRNAFHVAQQVQDLEWSPADQSARAAANMQDYLDEGEVELIVLPVQVSGGHGHHRGRNVQVAAQLQTALQQGPWQSPPAFVVVDNPMTVADLVNYGGVLDGEFRPATLALILRLAEADYAAYLQFLGFETTEFDVKSRTQTVKTRHGQSRIIVREDGQRRLQARARVVIANDFGGQIADVVVVGVGTAPFSRGVYDGDPDELNLGRNQIDLFDHYVLEAQEQAARTALVRDLASNIAGAVYQPTLAQIP